jgi:hypothetical protein
MEELGAGATRFALLRFVGDPVPMQIEAPPSLEVSIWISSPG